MQEWLNENSVRNFPFTSSEDSSLESLPQDFILDLKMFLSKSETYPAFIKKISFNSSTDSYYLEIALVSTNAVLISGAVGRLDNGLQRYRIVLGAGEAVAIITPGSGWHNPTYGLTNSWEKVFSPSNTLIEQSLTSLNPLVINRILIDPSDVADPLNGAMPTDTPYTVTSGFNISLDIANSNEDFINSNVASGASLVIGAEEGAGLGFIPYIQPPDDLPTVKTINGKGGDSEGNISFNIGDCIRISQPTVGINNPQPLPATLQLESDCVPCCGCKNFNQVVLNLKIKHARIIEMNNKLASISATAIAKYNLIKSKFEARDPIVVKL